MCTTYTSTPHTHTHSIVCREMTGAYIASDTYVQLEVECEILKCMGIMQDNLCHISIILSTTTILSDTVLFYFAGKFACHLNQLRYVRMYMLS